MGIIKKAIYKVDNGTDFDEIHFKTSAEQVELSDGTILQDKIDEWSASDTHYIDVEGSNISFESEEGYLENVEIHGNTWQDANNLSDIKSVGTKVEGQELYEIPVLSTGKNLFDKNNYLNMLDDYDYIDTGYKCKKIKLKPRTNYFVSAKGSSSVGTLLINNTYSVFRDGYVDFRSSKKISKKLTSDGNGFLYIGTNITDVSLLKSLLDRDIQIEEGDVESPYSEPSEHKLTILSPTPLEKVGDIADRIICKDGVWGVEKNIKTVTFHGSEGWTKVTTKPITQVFSLPINDLALCKPISNRFIADAPGDAEKVSVAYENSTGRNILYIALETAKLSTTPNGYFREWLEANPTTLKYLTTRPEFIPLPYDQQIKLRTFAGRTNIHFETEIEPTIKVKVLSNISNVVKLLQEKVSVLENKFIEGLKQVLAGDMMSLAYLLYPEDFEQNEYEVKTLEEL